MAAVVVYDVVARKYGTSMARLFYRPKVSKGNRTVVESVS
jgi:hypothetical protein